MKTQGYSSWYSRAKMWQNVGNVASEEGTSGEKPKDIFGAVGPKTWENVGNLTS